MISVQECDRFHDFFYPVLHKFFGYDGVFCPKRDSPCLKHGFYSDGVAVFWKKEKFRPVRQFAGVLDAGNPVCAVVLEHVHTAGEL